MSLKKLYDNKQSVYYFWSLGFPMPQFCLKCQFFRKEKKNDRAWDEEPCDKCEWTLPSKFQPK
jgi:hypothetical protein